MGSKNKKLNLDKDTLYNLYISQQLTCNEVASLLNCTSKSIRNYLEKYKIPIRPNSEAVKLERSKWTEDREAARSLKFMQNWKNKSNEEKQAIIAARTKNINSPEAIAKAKQTKAKNNTYVKSKAELEFGNKLKIIFGNSDVLNGYYDVRYPYNCDFYIKSKDLFIEYQGHQTHGYEPYDKLNPKHREYIEYYEQHGVDMTTFTVRDPKKLQIATKNKIKLLLIYPKNNTYLLFNGQIKNLGKINCLDINDIE